MTLTVGSQTVTLPDRLAWTYGDLRRFKAAQGWTDKDLLRVTREDPSEFTFRLALYVSARDGFGLTEAGLEAAEPAEVVALCDAINARVGAVAEAPVDRPPSTPSTSSPSGTDGDPRTSIASPDPN